MGEPGPGGDAGGRVSVVVPVRNAMEFLPRCLPTIVEAVQHHGAAELIVVDNGSDDGSYELLKREFGDVAAILRLPAGSVGAVRNHGARHATGEFLAFIDADCMIPPDYLQRALAVLDRTEAAATGSWYALPPSPTRIEETWSDMHTGRGDGYVHVLPAGNLFVRRAAFDEIGGFHEGLLSGEDAELGQRLLEHGHRIYEAAEVRAVHLGNAKTSRAFLRQQVWHGLGMLGTVRRGSVDRPTVMLGFHIVFLLLAALVLVVGPLHWAARLGAAGILASLVPALSAGYRGVQTGGLRRPLTAVWLYQLYYLARLIALWRIAFRRVDGYRTDWRAASRARGS